MIRNLVGLFSAIVIAEVWALVAYCAVPWAVTLPSSLFANEPTSIILGLMGCTLVLLGSTLACESILTAVKSLYALIMYRSKIRTALYVLSLEEKME